MNLLCVGIIDDLGLDRLVPASNVKEFNSAMNALSLRCRYNGRRNPRVFSVLIDIIFYESFVESKLEAIPAADFLVGLETFNIIPT